MLVDLPTRPGEVFDKFTILILKTMFASKSGTRGDAMLELIAISASLLQKKIPETIMPTVIMLLDVNRRLWDAEAAIRVEGVSIQDKADLIDQIHSFNKMRYNMKLTIDETMGSDYLEVKDYSKGSR